MGGLRTYRRAPYAVHELHYHLVLTTKYRKSVLKGEIALAVRDLTRQVCHAHESEILAGDVRPDHVPLLVSVPPNGA